VQSGRGDVVRVDRVERVGLVRSVVVLDVWRVESCGDDPWDEGGGEFAGLLGGEQQRDSGVNDKGRENGEG
jgi:hypothetical protein